jgi:thioredoxin-dependent peroxiredoxin
MQLISLLLAVVLFVVCNCNLSAAYSTTNSVNVHRRGTSTTLTSAQLANNDIDNEIVVQKQKIGGRRAFFQHTAASSIAAMAISLLPQTANAAASKKQPIPTLGSIAPPFSLINTRGQTTTLDTLTSSKKWTILYFYPGAFTSGCTLEAQKFQQALPQFQENNAQIVGVSVDDVAKNAEFCTSEKLDFFMLTDANGEVSKAYGTSLSVPMVGTFSNRQTYIIDPEKKIRWVFKDVESNIPTHAEDVLNKLKELQMV